MYLYIGYSIHIQNKGVLLQNAKFFPSRNVSHYVLNTMQLILLHMECVSFLPDLPSSLHELHLDNNQIQAIEFVDLSQYTQLQR